MPKILLVRFFFRTRCICKNFMLMCSKIGCSQWTDQQCKCSKYILGGINIKCNGFIPQCSEAVRLVTGRYLTCKNVFQQFLELLPVETGLTWIISRKVTWLPKLSKYQREVELIDAVCCYDATAWNGIDCSRLGTTCGKSGRLQCVESFEVVGFAVSAGRFVITLSTSSSSSLSGYCR